MTLMKFKLLVRHIGVKYIVALSVPSLVAARGQARSSRYGNVTEGHKTMSLYVSLTVRTLQKEIMFPMNHLHENHFLRDQYQSIQAKISVPEPFTDNKKTKLIGYENDISLSR
jgi:hypothetical protein